MARNFDNDDDEDEINYRYDSEVSTPRSEGFDYPAAAGSAAAGGRENSMSQSGSENESPDRPMDEAHREVDGSRESLSERFKRYIRRILPIGNGRRSPPRAEIRVRKEFRVPLDRYGRHHSPHGSSSSDNYEFDEQYDQGPSEMQHDHDHDHGHHHHHHGHHHHHHHHEQHQNLLPEEGASIVGSDYEDEVYDPSPESASSSLHSGHVHHRYIRSGVARNDNEPQVAAADGNEEEQIEEDDDGDDGVSDNETELTDSPLTARTRSTSGSGRSSSSSGRSLASSRRRRSSSGVRSAATRSRSRTRSSSRGGGRSAAGSRSRTRSSSRGSRRSSAGSRRSAQKPRQSRTRRRS